MDKTGNDFGCFGYPKLYCGDLHGNCLRLCSIAFQILFMAVLKDFKVTALMEGSVTMSMLIENEKHTNPEGFIHNGILFKLADLVMEVAILTAGAL